MGGVSQRRRIRRKWRQLRPSFAKNSLALLFSLSYLYISSTPYVASLEPKILSIWYSLRGALPPPEEVVIVSIDDSTYRVLKLSRLQPAPRRYLTMMLERLSLVEPKAVVFDLMFTDIGLEPEEDERFALALSKTKTILGSAKVEKSYFKLPLPLLLDAAAATGSVMLPLEKGQSMRFPTFKSEPPGIDSLSFQVVSQLSAGSIFPTPRDFIKFYGPPHTIRAVSLHEVLDMDESRLRETFASKVVIVGSNTSSGIALAQKDAFLTPASDVEIAGVEIHATIISNLLRQEWIKRWPQEIERTIIAIFVFITTLLILKLSPAATILLAPCLLAGTFYSAYSLFTLDLFIPIGLVTLILIPAAVVVSIVYYYLSLRTFAQELESALTTSNL